MKNNYSLIYLILLVALSSFLFFYKLGNLSLWDPDEPRYAQAAKEMVKSGDWLVPRFNTQERFDKPVLFYWLIALAYKVFGISEFAARLWSALFGLAGVIMVYLLGKKMFSPLIGFLSALILATNIQYLTLSRLAITDMTLTFFLELTFFSFWFAYQTKNKFKKDLFYLIFYISTALATLTKGPVAIVFSSFIVLVFLAMAKDLKVLKEMKIFWGLAVFALITFPWYILIIQKYGRHYVNYFFLQHNLARFATPDFKHPGPFIYYLPVILIGLFPWSAFLFSGLGYFIAKRNNLPAEDKKPLIFLFIWFTAIFLFFSTAKSKLPTYIMPLYFPAALLMGKFLGILAEAGEEIIPKSYIKISLGLLIIFFLSVTVALSVFLKLNCPGSLILSLAFNVLFLLGLVFILFFFKTRRFLNAYLCLVWLMVIFTILILERVAPRVSQQRSLKEAAREIVSLSKGQSKIFSYCFLKPSLVFYGDQPIKRLESFTELKEVLNYPERIFCWIDSDDEYYEQIKDLIKEKAWIVARTPTKLVISNKP